MNDFCFFSSIVVYSTVHYSTLQYSTVQHSTVQYWKINKSRSKWDFICWYVGDCKKWSSKDRADTGVNIKLYSSLKCVYEKLRDFLEDEGGKEMYTIKKYKFKSTKRKKTTDYPDNLTDV